MREHLFRGRRIDNGEWVYGSLLQSEITTNGNCSCLIVMRFAHEPDIARFVVIPDTAGQYTDRFDKNNTRIFADDIIEGYSHGTINSIGKIRGVVKWDESLLTWNVEYTWKSHSKEPHKATEQLFRMYDIEIVGNIHDTQAK